MDSIAKLKEIKTRRDFYAQFGKDPVTFLKTWLASQTRDLDLLFGHERGGEAASVNPQTLKTMLGGGEWVSGEIQKRYSKFYQQSWVEEAVRLYETREFNEKVMRATSSSGPTIINHHHPTSGHNGSMAHHPGGGTSNGLMGAPNGGGLAQHHPVGSIRR